MRRVVRSLLLVAAVAGGAVATTASAGPGQHVSEAARVSGPSPYPAACSSAAPDYIDSESEVSLAVDPRDDDHLLATYHQDYGVGHPVSRSADGGESWQETAPPVLTPCANENPVAYNVFDPWISYGPDGRAYLSSVSGGEPGSPTQPGWGAAGQQDFLARHVYVQTSDDNGATWGAPIIVGGDVDDSMILDKPSVTADPYRAGVVYATWGRISVTGASVVDVARSVDGGAQWTETTIPIVVAGTKGVTFGSQIVALPDGTVLLSVAAAFAQPLALANVATGAVGGPTLPFIGDTQFYALRSTDGGATFLPVASPIGSARTFPSVVQIAAAGNAVYAGWTDVDTNGSGVIDVARSTDGGLSWGSPVTVTGTIPHAVLGGVAVDGDGTAGISWYQQGDSDGTARAMFASSSDGGLTWTTTPLTPSFDVTHAPSVNQAGGQQLGDYQGLVGLHHGGFVSAITVAGALSHVGPTDVVANRVQADRR